MYLVIAELEGAIPHGYDSKMGLANRFCVLEWLLCWTTWVRFLFRVQTLL